MTRIAQALGVSRSHLAERKADQTAARPCQYRKERDDELLRLIRDILDERQTYGYRRVLVLLNRQLALAGQPCVNHKRVYRIMRQNGLLLARHSGKRPQRAHDGKVITLRRNTRWCSDGFEIPCDNRDVVRVAFALDSCDREALGFVATTGGLSGSLIRDLMLECVERRFAALRTPHPVEWLSDNGSCYTAKETIEFASWLGLLARFTPVRSPESNGMAEAFVKTFKRDYVGCHRCPDAATVMRQLPAWFEDYNENAPHKGLRMRSPREFIRSLQTNGCPVL